MPHMMPIAPLAYPRGNVGCRAAQSLRRLIRLPLTADQQPTSTHAPLASRNVRDVAHATIFCRAAWSLLDVTRRGGASFVKEMRPLHSGRGSGRRASEPAVRCSDGGEGFGAAHTSIFVGDERMSVFADARMTRIFECVH